ncbi:DUF1515 family protein [Rhodoligotrophos defluvii]|uniref:DUF1515 family protein n=1 Tax=Rhodoligotrophos defluvii TaxID=2561934 RepID=UPI0010C9C8C9|nr:DUF1515 family protein [Rhodoligotrophos defluvii]
MAGPDTSLHREIAQLSAKLDLLQTDVGEIKRAMREGEREAADSRRHLHEAVGGLGERMVLAERNIEVLEHAVGVIRPFADELERWKQRGIGAAFVLTFLGGLVGAGLTAFWSKLVAVLPLPRGWT